MGWKGEMVIPTELRYNNISDSIKRLTDLLLEKEQ